jgi:hypothetical protein
MPQGILIDLNDGRPPMQITAGLRAPAVTGDIQADGFDSANSTWDFGLAMTPGSSAFCLPRQAVYVDDFDVIPEVYFLNSFSKVNDSVGRIGIGNFNGAGGRLLRFYGSCFEILPATPGNQGLLVENSTNFTAIPNNARLMSAAYVGGLQVNGSASLPVSGIPFGMWDNPNVSLESDGTTIWCRDITYGGTDDVAASTYVNLVIFNNTPPPPGPGITMSNPAGQIVFSSVRRPFVLGGFIQINNGWQYVGGFFPIIRCGATTRVTGGYNNLRYKGICMSGGNVRAVAGTVIGNYSTQTGAQFPFDTNISMALPFTPNMY